MQSTDKLEKNTLPNTPQTDTKNHGNVGLYDISGALEQLQKTEQPALAKLGRKTNLLAKNRAQIRHLLRLGYTSEQVSRALSSTNFQVSAKLITQVARSIVTIKNNRPRAK